MSATSTRSLDDQATELTRRGGQREGPGIFRGIFSSVDRYPSPDEVLNALGDKVVAGLTEAVDGAREDLRLYRASHPSFVADSSERGLANWIHDRMWARATPLGDIDRVALVDSGATREIHLGNEFRIRLKRHSHSGAIRSYPTDAALEFIGQDQPDLYSLLGIRTLNLTAGYDWDDLTRSIGESVLSLRNGS